MKPENERLVHIENAELRARLQALESSVRQHAGLFYTLIEQAPIGVYVVDAEFRLRQVNALALPAFAKVPSCIGRDFSEVMAILWGDELAAQISAIFRRTLETGERYVSPRFVKHRQDLDEEKGYEWETQRVTLPDGRHCVVCYFSDITERVLSERALRESEERTRLAAEATGVGIWEWNLKTNEIRWDAQTFRMYGLEPTPDGKVPYSAWRDALLPQDVTVQEQLLQQTIQGKGPGRREFCIRRPGETICRHIQAIDTVRRNAAGEVEWIIGTNLDITEQRRTEKTLIDAKAVAESASRSKDRFLATLSHELRTPLMPVLITAESLREDPRLPAEVREQLTMIERNIALETRLIDDLLDITLVSQGKLKLRAEPVDAHSLIELAIAMVRAEATTKKINIECALTARHSGLQADSSRFQQVIWNLLRNAVKFTPEGGTVAVRTHDKTGKDGKAIFHLEVVDTGIGIEGNLLERIFEPFEQGAVSGNHRFGGMGLGLSIARAIVTLHGARVWAESDGAGCGATFSVEFPDAKVFADASPGAADDSAAIALNGEQGSLPAKRLLIVEDHAPTLEILTTLLTRSGHKVTAAAGFSEALAAAARETFDAVISDLGLPDGTGIQLMETLRAQYGLRGIALSGYGMDADLARTREAGFVTHLVKPIRINELKKALSELR